VCHTKLPIFGTVLLYLENNATHGQSLITHR